MEAGGSRLYGRAKGKTLRTEPRRLLADVLPKFRVPRDGAIDLAALFGPTVEEVWLEIGFGGAEHLIAQAEAHPRVGMIGVEPFVNGVAKALREIEAKGIANTRLDDGDARTLIARLPDASIARIFVLFPDPWPKRRHNKRRVISDESLAGFARVLKPGGEFLFASDIDDYVGWTLARVLRSPAFAWRIGDWLAPWPGSPATRYRQKALREGRTPVYLTFERASA